MDSTGRLIVRILSGLIVAVLVLFVIQNVASTTVTFLVWSFRAPLFVVIVISFCAGAIFGWSYRPWRER